MNHSWGTQVGGLGIALVTAVAVVTLPTPAGNTQPDTFGAISWSRRTGAQGYAWGYRSRVAAENRSLEECEIRAGTGDCRVLVWFRNACGSIAATRDGAVGTGWGSNTPCNPVANMDPAGSPAPSVPTNRRSKPSFR
jgi:hypothetical protein